MNKCIMCLYAFTHEKSPGNAVCRKTGEIVKISINRDCAHWILAPMHMVRARKA